MGASLSGESEELRFPDGPGFILPGKGFRPDHGADIAERSIELTCGILEAFSTTEVHSWTNIHCPFRLRPLVKK